MKPLCPVCNDEMVQDSDGHSYVCQHYPACVQRYYPPFVPEPVDIRCAWCGKPLERGKGSYHPHCAHEAKKEATRLAMQKKRAKDKEVA